MTDAFPHEPLHTVIVGGGIAALEAGLALRELAGDRVRITLLAPGPNATLPPLTAAGHFDGAPPPELPLAGVAADIGAEWCEGSFGWLDRVRRELHTGHGTTFGYDALVLAAGASRCVRFAHAETLDDRTLDRQLTVLTGAIDAGGLERLAIILPHRIPWPLPGYELALRVARHAREAGRPTTVTLVTPELEPLAVFGAAAAMIVGRRLTRHGVTLVPDCRCEVTAPGRIALHPSSEILYADRIIALPELHGPHLPGVPAHAAGGFISVDGLCRVEGTDDVFAAGDATDFPVKLGGVAAQQAEMVATMIAHRAGAGVAPRPLQVRLQGVLRGGGAPLALSADAAGRWGANSSVRELVPGARVQPLAAPRLTGYLATRERLAATRVQC